jgi:DNA invertase Pin-like site-specific DNA recombinase
MRKVVLFRYCISPRGWGRCACSIAQGSGSKKPKKAAQAMKAIILARVSTKEQEEGHSIAAQRQRLVDYCARRGLKLIKTYELVESSTRGERKEFAEMLEFALAQNETVAIVADAVDRFQRSFKESVLIDDLIRKERVELHFCRESMVIGKGASSTDILRWDFSVMGAKSYVLNLSENVRRSLEYKRRNGEWGGKAPLGYLNRRDVDNKYAHPRSRAGVPRTQAIRGIRQGQPFDQWRPCADGAGMGAQE